MIDRSKHTALVTGANSGLGLEASALLAEAGWGRVVVACRSDGKCTEAITALERRTGKKVFEPLVIDVAEPDSVEAAVGALSTRGARLDLLLLNAGVLSTSPPVRNTKGVDVGFAVANVGHHQLTVRLLERGLLTASARIVMAGSEAARGDVPGMKVPDFDALAKAHFGGDVAATLEALMRAEPEVPLSPNSAYAVSKSCAVWWAAALAKRLPKGVTVNTVSPGSVPDTNFGRNMGFFARHVMLPMMKVMGPMMGMAGPVDVAARRYLTAADYDDSQSGAFYASPSGKLVGPVQVHTQPHLVNPIYRDAAWKTLVKLSGVGGNL